MDSSEGLKLHCRECSADLHNYKLGLCRKCERKQNVLLVLCGLAGVGLFAFFVWCGTRN